MQEMAQNTAKSAATRHHVQKVGNTQSKRKLGVLFADALYKDSTKWHENICRWQMALEGQNH